MKYYVEYPIPICCNLQCSYCFHKEAWDLQKQGKFDEKYYEKCPFSVEDFIAWRDKYLSDGTEFLCDLQGGEMSCSQKEVFEIIDKLDKTKFQLQTNGLGEVEFYRELIKRKDKIDRIGFTYHREPISRIMGMEEAHAIDAFVGNVRIVKESGIKVYVKELFDTKNKAVILENKAYWEEQGVEFRLQDFRPYDRGYKPVDYTPEEAAMIHPEYLHAKPQCSCREGYKNVLIRGYDCFAGDVIACWKDPVVVGHIGGDDEFYNGTYSVDRIETDILDGMVSIAPRVTGVPEIFRGTFPRDNWTDEAVKLYPVLNKQQLKQRGNSMEAKTVNFAREQAEALRGNIKQMTDRRTALLQEAESVLTGIRQIEGAIAAYEKIVEMGNAEAAKLANLCDNVRNAKESLDAEADRVIAVKSARKEAIKKAKPKTKGD